MTDLERLKMTFDALGISYVVHCAERKRGPFYLSVSEAEIAIDICLSISEGTGYFGFHCDFYFESYTGKFIEHGVWE